MFDPMFFPLRRGRSRFSASSRFYSQCGLVSSPGIVSVQQLFSESARIFSNTSFSIVANTYVVGHVLCCTVIF